jgi:hypothetical protein
MRVKTGYYIGRRSGPVFGVGAYIIVLLWLPKTDIFGGDADNLASSARACLIDNTGEIVSVASENIGLWQPEQDYYVCTKCLVFVEGSADYKTDASPDIGG